MLVNDEESIILTEFCKTILRFAVVVVDKGWMKFFSFNQFFVITHRARKMEKNTMPDLKADELTITRKVYKSNFVE